MRTTAQERLALGVAALLVTLGAGARLVGGGDAGEWSDGPPPADTSHRELSGVRARAAENAARERRRSTPLAEGERIDPNTADVDELQRLPRVGPALAARIVERRTAHGPFRTLADFDSVPGVGPALLASAEPHLALPPAPRSPPPPAAATRQGSAVLAEAARAPARPVPGQRIDANRATAEELAALPGIGPALARRIVASRAADGPFRSARDLERVPGIGPKLRERLEPFLAQ